MKTLSILIVQALILTLTGCTTMTDTQRGTAQGTAIGAGTGAAIGALIGGKKGAAIGAGSGALLGAGAGYMWSQRMEEQKGKWRQPPQVQACKSHRPKTIASS